MAKTTAPMLSFGAAGQISKTLVYARWRGVPYARRYIVPANPKSANQTKTRSVFTWLTQTWKNLASGAQAPWKAYATGKPLTDRNGYLKFNVQALRPGTDMTALVGSPGANGGVPLTTFSATGAAGAISTTVAAPTPPTGWSISKVAAIARINDDPHTSTDYTTKYAEATSTPWEPAFTGLAAGSYELSAWIVWTKDDASLAYSPSSNATATVT